MGEPGEIAKQSADEAALLLDVLARRSGIEVPLDRKAGVVGVLQSVLRTAALLHTERSPTHSSGQVYRMDTVLRALDRRP